MEKQLKKLKKNARRVVNHINSDRGLTMKMTYDISTAFYSHGKEKTPHVIFARKGDYKISVVKLVLCIVGAGVALSAALLALKALFERLTAPRLSRVKAEKAPEPLPLPDEEIDEDNIVKF